MVSICPLFVLNAFRHHWNFHVVMLGSPHSALSVLNAFRHHWNFHGIAGFAVMHYHVQCSTPFGIIGIFTGSRYTVIKASHACSTPFGIIGIFTQRLSASLEFSPAVLNAFRHHWNFHPPARADFCDLNLCSTPFGIIGIFTVLLPKHVNSDICELPFGDRVFP